jgi:hypothetical protein
VIFTGSSSSSSSSDRKLCSNKFTWCFHKQNYYIFYRHADVERTYAWIFIVLGTGLLLIILYSVKIIGRSNEHMFRFTGAKVQKLKRHGCPGHTNCSYYRKIIFVNISTAQCFWTFLEMIIYALPYSGRLMPGSGHVLTVYSVTHEPRVFCHLSWFPNWLDFNSYFIWQISLSIYIHGVFNSMRIPTLL